MPLYFFFFLFCLIIKKKKLNYYIDAYEMSAKYSMIILIIILHSIKYYDLKLILKCVLLLPKDLKIL